MKKLFSFLLFLFLLPSQVYAAIAYTGQCSGTTNCTISSGIAAGDLIVAFAFRDGNNTAPTIPGSPVWNTISNAAGANSNGAAFVWRVASGTSEASGTFTSATSFVMASFSGANTTDIGGAGDAEGSSTTVRYPGVTMETGDGTSWIVTCMGTRAADTGVDLDANAPSGFSTTTEVVSTDATDEAVCWNSGAGLASFANTDVAVGGSSSGWHGKTIELKVAAAVTDTPFDPFGMSGFFGQ